MYLYYLIQRPVSELYLKAVKMACVAHAVKNYRGKPYYTHLEDVEQTLIQYGFGYNEVLMICAWLHDTQEDAGFTYNDIKREFGVEVADIVYLVTDFKGHNRNERKPDELYLQMRENMRAVILKVADRLANVRASVLNGDSMGKTYKKEYSHFRELLYNADNRVIQPMWNELDKLMDFKTE